MAITEQRKTSKWRPFQIGGALVVSGLALTAFLLPDELPLCSSTEAKDLLRQAFDTSQSARLLSLLAIEVQQVGQLSYSKDSMLRSCRADLTLNNGRDVGVSYDMQGRQDGSYLLTFKVTRE